MAEDTRTERGLLLCDQCGKVADMLQIDLGSRDTDYLCWPCLFTRATAVLATLTAEAEAEEANAVGR